LGLFLHLKTCAVFISKSHWWKYHTGLGKHEPYHIWYIRSAQTQDSVLVPELWLFQ
jgi:hypothetical protein